MVRWRDRRRACTKLDCLGFQIILSSLSGYLAIVGQILDATLSTAPKQSNTRAEKNASKMAQKASEIRPDEPAGAPQNDTDARSALQFAKAKSSTDRKRSINIAIPNFDDKSSISTC